jgi:hypothetical protein
MFSLFGLGEILTPSGGEIAESPNEVESDEVSFFAAAMKWTLTDAIAYIAAVSLVEPLYVAAGFSLYLNRRTILEGWDLEIQLRKLGNRLAKGATLMITVLGCATLLATSGPGVVHAADAPPADPAELIRQVLAEPEFDQVRTVKRWRSLNPEEDDQRDGQVSQPWFENLATLLADISQALLWISAAVLVALLFYVVRKFVPEAPVPQQTGHQAPTDLFGLNLAPESLPQDLCAVAARLAAEGRTREALSLLYRGALSALTHRYRIAIGPGATEGDCVEAAQSACDSQCAEYFSSLVTTWQRLAYAGHEPQLHQLTVLCNDWPAHFGATVATPPHGS